VKNASNKKVRKFMEYVKFLVTHNGVALRKNGKRKERV